MPALLCAPAQNTEEAVKELLCRFRLQNRGILEAACRAGKICRNRNSLMVCVCSTQRMIGARLLFTWPTRPQAWSRPAPLQIPLTLH